MNPNEIEVTLVDFFNKCRLGFLRFEDLKKAVVYKTQISPEETQYAVDSLTITFDDTMDEPHKDHIVIKTKGMLLLLRGLKQDESRKFRETLDKLVKEMENRSVTEISEKKNVPEDIERKIKTYLGGRRKTRRTRRTRSQK